MNAVKDRRGRRSLHDKADALQFKVEIAAPCIVNGSKTAPNRLSISAWGSHPSLADARI